MSTVIKVENLAKQYRLGLVDRKTFVEDIQRFWNNLQGKEDPFLSRGETNDRETKGDDHYVWSLNDISFDVNEGDVLGVIGRNGAGKSTLLKILSRVTAPTKGNIKIKGRISSLLEVGTGFHPELTGLENIYLNGAILGMKKSEIKQKMEEIIAFAGVEKYIDTPVKRYSSGMYVRLAFAVAAHLENEILIVDEVLAVGDAEFQERCLGKMKDVSKQGRTVVFVSHNMSSVKDLCKTGLLLESGKLSYYGNVEDALSKYLNRGGDISHISELGKTDIEILKEGVFSKTAPTLSINRLYLESNNEIKNQFFSNENISVGIELNVNEDIHELCVACKILDDKFNEILVTSNLDDDSELSINRNKFTVGKYHLKCNIPNNLLATNKYFLSLEVINKKNEHVYLNNALSFDVVFSFYNNESYFSFEKSLLRPKFVWNLIVNEKC
jgi:lipopolysaccharide transport system ATP-binding protein